MKKQYTFTPDWLSGFTQADGSFVVLFTKQKHGKMPYRPRPAFVLAQSNKEIEMIEFLHDYLQVGYVRKSLKSIYIVVDSKKDLLEKIIPHFDKHPVKAGKNKAYQTFREVVLSIDKGLHLRPDGFISILDTCYFMNSTSLRTEQSKAAIILSIKSKYGEKNTLEGSTSVLKESITGVTKITPLSIDYLTGLIDGDGSFGISFGRKKSNVIPFFTISADILDYDLLCEVKDFFGTGVVSKAADKEYAQYRVHSQKAIIEHILPSLELMQFNTNKRNTIGQCIQAWNIIYNGGIASKDNFTKVVNMLYNVNSGGKYRKMTMKEYLSLFESSSLYLS